MTLTCALLLFFAVHAEEPAYVLKTDEADPPTELKEAIRKEMGKQRLQVFDKKGDLHCELWLRAKVPVKATPEQVANGLSLKDIEQATLIGALRLPRTLVDYRKQEIAAGVYTLRLAIQPQDGDHQGTAPHSEFLLAVAAANDETPAAFDVKKLHEKSAEAVGVGGAHPGVLLLFPNPKPETAPKLAQEPPDLWTVRHCLTLEADGKPAKLGFGLCVSGHSATRALR